MNQNKYKDECRIQETPRADRRHKRRNLWVLLGAGLWTLCAGASTAEEIDRAVISAIRYEGLQGSQAFDHLVWLSDVYGPRVTGTPAIRDASDWAMRQLENWGLANVHREYWKFGPGWSIRKAEMRMIEPQVMRIIGYPFGWSQGTNGPITAEVVNPVLATEADLARWRGKLRGKIVLVQPEREVHPPDLPLVQRFSDEELQAMETSPVPWQWLSGEWRDGKRRRPEIEPDWHERLTEYLAKEGVAATVERGPDSVLRPAGAYADLTPQMTQKIDGGTVFTPSGRNEIPYPRLCIAVEQYNRMVRILRLGISVRITLDIEVEWYPEGDPPNGFNTLAELPGSDLRDETVILGAHFDSVHTSTGAVDNAAGVAIVMEAMRLLARLDVKPRRTIRLALWGGEETGMLGSTAYARRHFGDPVEGPPYSREAAKVSVYFNVDSGSGRIRGLFTRHNLAAEPVLERWFEPVHDLGATAVLRHSPPSLLSNRKLSSGSDHLVFDALGIPSFEMLQDRLDYFSRTAHSNMDYADRAVKADLVQAAVVTAVLAYQASMSDARVPRRAPPLPLGSSIVE